MEIKDGDSALQSNVEQHQTLPDILLLDINMPVMDGWEFMEEIQALKSRFKKTQLFI